MPLSLTPTMPALKGINMQYKTIVLGLLEQHPKLHEQLRRERTLLTTVEAQAVELKARHEFWMEAFSKANWANSPIQISNAALEVAVKELADSLAAGSPQAEPETLSLDGAMEFLRQRSLIA